MSRQLYAMTLVIVLILGETDLLSQPLHEPSGKHIVVLNKFRKDFVSSLMSNAPSLLAPYFADSIRLMPPFQKTTLDKKAAASYYEAFLSRFTLHELAKRETEIMDLGGQLMEIGTLTFRVTLKSTGKEYRLKGKYMDLWITPGTGDPLMVTGTWNFDEFYGEIHDQLRFDNLPSVHTAMLPNVPVTNSLQLELAAYNRLLDATVTQHDASTWALYYAEDALLLASYYPMCKGKKAINEYIETHVKELPVFEELDIRNDRVDDLGTFVIEYASHIASWRNRGTSGVNMGKNIRVWRRLPGQPLRLFRSIGNYD